MVICIESLSLFSLKIYPVKERSSDRKRLALLINNVEFEYLDNRDGAEKDEMSMERLLKALGYTVLTLRDLTAQVHTHQTHWCSDVSDRYDLYFSVFLFITFSWDL